MTTEITKKKKLNNNKQIGYGYVGRWRNGEIGWCMPEFLMGNKTKRRYTDGPSDKFNRHAQPQDRAVLCKITVEVVKDSRGREITRRPKKD